MGLTNNDYKDLSIREFTKAAAFYESEQAKKKNIKNATFVVGDCENFPFEENSFDAIICSMSFHHYPNPQAFFNSVKRCLRPNGRLILRDMTSDNPLVSWLVNNVELPLARLCGKGDYKMASRKTVVDCCNNAGLVMSSLNFFYN